MHDVYVYDMSNSPKTKRLQLVMSEKDLALLDEWRRQQDDIPNRSEAVRRMIGILAPTVTPPKMVKG